MTVQLVVSFLALSIWRDSLSVSIYLCPPNNEITINVPRDEPILIQYNQWKTYYTPVFSGHIKIFEDRAFHFSLHYVPNVYVLLTHSMRRGNVDYLPYT